MHTSKQGDSLRLLDKVVEWEYFRDVIEKVNKKKSNKEKSRRRERVEHVFGFMERSMNKLYSLCKKTPNTALFSFLKQSSA